MSASQDECIAAFPQLKVCQDRVYGQVMKWSAYIGAQPLPPPPTPPEKAFVQQRIMAQRFPLNGQMQNVPGISSYLSAVPNIVDKIRDHLNAYNDEATETALASDIDNSLATVMPIYCNVVVSDQEVADWCDRNGYERPEGLIGVFSMSPLGAVPATPTPTPSPTPTP